MTAEWLVFYHFLMIKHSVISILCGSRNILLSHIGRPCQSFSSTKLNLRNFFLISQIRDCVIHIWARNKISFSLSANNFTNSFSVLFQSLFRPKSVAIIFWEKFSFSNACSWHCLSDDLISCFVFCWSRYLSHEFNGRVWESSRNESTPFWLILGKTDLDTCSLLRLYLHRFNRSVFSGARSIFPELMEVLSASMPKIVENLFLDHMGFCKYYFRIICFGY